VRRRPQSLGLFCLAIGLLSFSGAVTGGYDELAAWVRSDCDDYRALVTQTNHARNDHEVAAALRENVRRQRETIKILLKFARSHPDLRDAAQLGLSEEGQRFWREHHPERTTLSSEIKAKQRQLTDCMDSAVSKDQQQQMVAVLRKYPNDAEILAASKLLNQMWAESDRSLLEVLLLGEDSNTWLKDGKRVADTPSMKSKNGFGAQLFLTESAQFFEDWNKSETPKLPTLEKDKAHRNVPLFTAILFVDPGLDATGLANVTCDIVVRKPDGSVYGEQRNIVGWKGKYLVPHNLQLTQGRMGIRIEPQDPSGTYTVDVTVRDHIKKIELPLKATFEIAP
jgi:2-oxo-4-hydroxy-4-carboxy--5-ureidoimidazoline (OHCU) decarboxylase